LIVTTEMVEQCSLCSRRRGQTGEFCNLHNAALANLEHCYVSWTKAFGRIEKDMYYSELEKLADTGSAVKEVIKRLREKRANA
jgi:hypothetical protein